jgi:translation initiation factor 2D
MFAKEGSSTIGGKKDSPLKKSDRRKLRDRTLEILFTGGGGDSSSKFLWTDRAEKLISDAILAPRGGDLLSRKLKLNSGENATLFLRTPTADAESTDDKAPVNIQRNKNQCFDDILETYPTTWPYHQSTQSILLEYEDVDRSIHLIPLLPLLAALPPPMPSSPLTKVESSTNDDASTHQYRIPNISVHAEVSKYICRGADLMSAGIRTFPSPWALRQSRGLTTISIIGNPQPAAIGFVDRNLFREYCYPRNGGNNLSEYDASSYVGIGKKGVGVSIVNCYGDDLWKHGMPKSTKQHEERCLYNPLTGGSYDNGSYGNAGFVDGKYVYPVLQENDDVESDDEGNADADEVNNNDEIACEKVATELEEIKISVSDEGTQAAQNTENENNEEMESKADHDHIVITAFFISLLRILANKTSLPIPVSIYYAKHLMDAVPEEGPKLDMKQTSYKKIGPFLQEMASDGLIQISASKDGKDKCAFLSDIMKNHPDLVAFKKRWKAEYGAESFMTTSQDKPRLAVVDLFIVPHHVAKTLQLEKEDVMGANAKTEERRGSGFLTKKECNTLIENYIEREELRDPNGKGRVLVNGPLCDAFYRASKKNKAGEQEQEYPTSVKRKDLVETFFDKMEKGHALVEMPGSRIVRIGRGAPPSVDIEVENRQGNKRKYLTRIRGMEEYGIDGESLSNDVSHRFACSASIETCPVGRPALKKNRVEIVFQGRLDVELTALLTGDEKLSTHGGAKNAEYNLPKSVINVVLRKGIPAKKK